MVHRKQERGKMWGRLLEQESCQCSIMSRPTVPSYAPVPSYSAPSQGHQIFISLYNAPLSCFTELSQNYLFKWLLIRMFPYIKYVHAFGTLIRCLFWIFDGWPSQAYLAFQCMAHNMASCLRLYRSNLGIWEMVRFEHMLYTMNCVRFDWQLLRFD